MPLNDHLAHPPKSGMIVRSKLVLSPGLKIFKLGHRFDKNARQDDEQVIAKPWWFTEGTVELICQTSERSGETLADAFRRFGAVAKRWGGSADLIVKAEVAEPIVAYIGPGTTQDFRNQPGESINNTWDMPLWVPSANIPQIYIPLANKSKPGSSIAKSALYNIYVVPLDKWDSSFLRGNPKSKWKL
jgi:hypothetical protein